MPDEPITPTVPEPATDPGAALPPAEPSAPADPPAPADLGDNGKKALAEERAARRALEKELAELKPLADEARKAAEARKTAEQKLTEKLEAATAGQASAELELARYKAALAKMPAGFDPAQLADVLKFLTGATPEELDANAEQLFALMAPQQQAPSAPTQPGRPAVQNLRPGALPAAPELSLSDQIRAADEAGDLALGMRLRSMQLAGLQAKTT